MRVPRKHQLGKKNNKSKKEEPGERAKETSGLSDGCRGCCHAVCLSEHHQCTVHGACRHHYLYYKLCVTMLDPAMLE